MEEFFEERWSDSRPHRLSAPQLVARAIRDIDGRGDFEHEVLLSALLCAAWPVATCQLQ